MGEREGVGAAGEGEGGEEKEEKEKERRRRRGGERHVLLDFPNTESRGIN